METIESIISWLNSLVWESGIPVEDGNIPYLVIALLGTGIFLTFRLAFVQFRRFTHGVAVATGRYDDPDEPGDVSHFQALTTALSATVGIGNIAGVAIAIHWGGPGALFWMWMTALLGMAVKYSEVTLAQNFRVTETSAGKNWGSVSGGPMYYIERGLGPKWKPLAMFFAGALMITAFMTGNAVQANTITDVVNANFGIAPWITGLVSAAIVGLVILGGISRIGKVTGILAPAMALIYVLGGVSILLAHLDMMIPSFQLIFREAFNPSAGVAGTGAGVFVLTMMWGVRRGLFSNEAGQGSAPIAHAAAKTDEPVSEGVVALLEPFIDTIVICSMTGLVILATGVWDKKHPTTIDLGSQDISYVSPDHRNVFLSADPPAEINIVNGAPVQSAGEAAFAYNHAAVDRFFVDAEQTIPFNGTLVPAEQIARSSDGATVSQLYGDAVELGAPLTSMAFEEGLGNFGLGALGRYIVLISVLLFGVSTSISWSYYGDRCANYLFGEKAILPYKFVFVLMHIVGAVAALDTVWVLGDVALGAVTFPNLIALILLSGTVAKLTKSYFERKPWIENAEVHKRVKEQKRSVR
ncbi:MAG: sodium:alanine symporter family protein [Bacteroidetes bacterium]|nr:sodium:alanine symporter family protein [Bacteroidota bacterium]